MPAGWRIDTTNAIATGDSGAMTPFTIPANLYLGRAVSAFCHGPYVGHKKAGNPDYLNLLKNTYNNRPKPILTGAAQQLRDVLRVDLSIILRNTGLEALVVCVVPRAKAEDTYSADQLLFKSTTQEVISEVSGLDDGTSYLRRHTNTKTTHLRGTTPNYNNDGPAPFRGITAQTCHISNRIKRKDVLLIDDIYTHGVNIDEDAIQALLDADAHSVTFYAVARTQSKG